MVSFNIIYPFKYIEIVEKYSEEYDLAASLVFAVIHAESRFRPDAVSKKGAGGLMQIAEITADWAANELPLTDFNGADIFDPEINIKIGCWYLSKLNKQFGGVTETVLAAYNAGSGNVSSWLKDDRYSDDGRVLRFIPFGETRLYIKKVNDNVPIYEFMHGARNAALKFFERFGQ